jgi:ABC-type Na+ efflux pump permease subunit
MEQNFTDPNNKKIHKSKRWLVSIIATIISTLILGGIALFIHYDSMRFTESNSKKTISNYETQNSSASSKESPETESETTSNTNNFAYLKYDTIDISEETYTTEINSNEIAALTCGPALINDNYLLGGANPDRGSVIVLLPENNNSTSYTFNKLVPYHNWFGVYTVNEINEANLQYIINERIDLMRKPPNGTSGLGCKIIDVLVLSGQKKLFNKTYQY